MPHQPSQPPEEPQGGTRHSVRAVRSIEAKQRRARSDAPHHQSRFTKFRRALVLVFAGGCALAAARLFHPLWRDSGWPDAALLLLATLATVAALAEQLPAPNVVLAGGLAAFTGGFAHAINSVTGWPFGGFEFTAPGPRALGLVPWTIPLLWFIALLNARAVARLVLHRLRHHPRHGYHVIGLATLLVVWFALGLIPFGSGVKNWWPAPAAPWLGLASLSGLTLVIQVAMTPLLLDKFPNPRPPNFWPLLVWICVNALLAIGLGHAGLAVETVVTATGLMVFAALALRPAATKC